MLEELWEYEDAADRWDWARIRRTIRAWHATTTTAELALLESLDLDLGGENYERDFAQG